MQKEDLLNYANALTVRFILKYKARCVISGNRTKTHIQRLNSAVRYATNNLAHLKLPKIQHRILRIAGYSDAALANNHNLTWQLGRIIFVIDSTSTEILILFKRETRSVLLEEVMAFTDMFDDAYALHSQFEHVLGNDVPMGLLADSKSLFNITSKVFHTSEKSIMPDLHASR